MRHITFSLHQHNVHKAFGEMVDMDIPISVLYLRIYGEVLHNKDGDNIRAMQMKLAPTFRTMNQKWVLMNCGKQIVPGELKQTYRIQTDRG